MPPCSCRVHPPAAALHYAVPRPVGIVEALDACPPRTEAEVPADSDPRVGSDLRPPRDLLPGGDQDPRLDGGSIVGPARVVPGKARVNAKLIDRAMKEIGKRGVVLSHGVN